MHTRDVDTLDATDLSDAALAEKLQSKF